MSQNKHTRYDLAQMQSLPLEAKIRMTQRRIQEWYEVWDGQVYVSFSGGKDSTALLDIARKMYPDIEAVFIDTGLEYLSVRKFATSQENVTVLRPTMNFRDVICKYGYPIVSKEVSQTIFGAKRSKGYGKLFTHRMKKLNNEATDKDGNLSSYNIPQWKFLLDAPFDISHKCCDVMKKSPAKKYEKQIRKKAIIATMADESRLRKEKWQRNGCNAFKLKRPQSNPMSFWTEQDVLTYIHTYSLPISEAYGNVIVKGTESGQMCIADMLEDYTDCKFCTTGCKRTGCIFCLFGIRQDLNRIKNLQKIEPKRADYVLRGGAFCYRIFDKNGKEIKIKHCNSEQIRTWCRSNSGNQNFKIEELWKPDNRGLGYWFILDWLALHEIVVPYENAEHYRETYGNKRTRELLREK